MDINFLFWNLHKNPSTLDVLSKSLQEQDSKIAILCEYPEELSNQQQLNDLIETSIPLLSGFKIPPKNISTRIKILSSYEQESINIIEDGYYYSLFTLALPYVDPILIVAVHMVSRTHEDDPSIDFYNLSRIIKETEKDIGHDRTIVIGDFNQNPFDDGMISAGGLHAVMDKGIAMSGKGGRKVRHERYPFFYNPMWNFLGDSCNGHLGTYYYRINKNKCVFWNIFDQVLIRPSLIKTFNQDSLEIITSVGNISLIKNNKQPNSTLYSDHLPIRFTLEYDDDLIRRRKAQYRQEYLQEYEYLKKERLSIDV